MATFNVLTGENGAGKTNVLEAISLFAPGRGLRRAKPSDMDKGGETARACLAMIALRRELASH